MSSSSLSDPYASSYYTSMPYSLMNQGLGETVWNNQDPMSFLNGYGSQINNNDHYIDGTFAQNGFNAYNAGYNYFSNAGNNDNSAWGNSALGTQKTGHGTYQDDYYRDSYNPSALVRHVEQGISGLSITVQNETAQPIKDNFGKSNMMHGNAMVKNQFGKKFSSTMNDGMGLSNSIPAMSGQLAAPKKMSWANVASQPAKPQAKIKPKPIQSFAASDKQSTMDIGTWESKHNKSSNITETRKVAAKPKSSINWNLPQGNKNDELELGYIPPPHPTNRQTAASEMASEENYPSHPVLDKLRKENNYNPKEFDLNPKNVKFFIIKSYSEDDIHRSIKYSIWCSTEHGNKRLNQAYRDAKGPVYLFFSVNGSGHFCGMAQMISQVDYQNTASVWAQNKWKGQFQVKWIYVKDVPNSQLRHIRLENNENKPITNSRDTQEVPPEKGKQMMKIMHTFRHITSIFDDFLHYEKRQEEDDQRKPQVTY